MKKKEETAQKKKTAATPSRNPQDYRLLAAVLMML